MPGPVRSRDAPDRDAAILAVERAVEIEVALDLPEIGQHVVPAPARGAAGLPFVVVGRRAAVGQLAVDRGAAAQHARLLVFAQRRAILPRVVVADDLGRDLELGPVEARIEIGRARIAVADFGRLVAGRRVLARLAEQHLVGAAAESRWARTEPAEPPPTMIVSYTLAFPFLFLCWEASAALRFQSRRRLRRGPAVLLKVAPCRQDMLI